ncbi:MAG: ribulose-phosphate 3-epimerase, partial [Aquiluna sp.]|nr:ribulose-phosphate 3-epimerase [Aquiluna sp.]
MHIHPSILSADYSNFALELASISTADAAHVDVMDNHFVPNLTFGLGLVESLLKVTQLPLDIHLMIE